MQIMGPVRAPYAFMIIVLHTALRTAIATAVTSIITTISRLFGTVQPDDIGDPLKRPVIATG